MCELCIEDGHCSSTYRKVPGNFYWLQNSVMLSQYVKCTTTGVVLVEQCPA